MKSCDSASPFRLLLLTAPFPPFPLPLPFILSLAGGSQLFCTLVFTAILIILGSRNTLGVWSSIEWSTSTQCDPWRHSTNVPNIIPSVRERWNVWSEGQPTTDRRGQTFIYPADSSPLWELAADQINKYYGTERDMRGQLGTRVPSMGSRMVYGSA